MRRFTSPGSAVCCRVRVVASILRTRSKNTEEPTALSDSRTISDRSFLIDDAARVLGVSRRTVYYRIREGRLRTIRTKCGSQRVLLSSMEVLLREGAGEVSVRRAG
jgi:excisionase family DNA binding protein